MPGKLEPKGYGCWDNGYTRGADNQDKHTQNKQEKPTNNLRPANTSRKYAPHQFAPRHAQRLPD
eukprot:5085968-Lingulodinium_polyedra.AAC.1